MVPADNFALMNFEEDIKESLNTLRSGGVIIYPTDTIWGLGCDPTNQEAVDKIFTIKSRADTKSLIILVDGMYMAERYVKEIPEIAYELTEVSDTPITIIYPEGKNLSEGVCAEDGSVAIRICSDEFCKQLISRFRKPLVSTSANISGAPPPGNFSEIGNALLYKADFIVRYRQNECCKKTASPVIKINKDGTIKIIRK